MGEGRLLEQGNEEFIKQVENKQRVIRRNLVKAERGVLNIGTLEQKLTQARLQGQIDMLDWLYARRWKTINQQAQFNV